MQIERILYPVETLGPGRRLAIWTVGCTKGCFGCISRELWTPRPDKDIPISRLIAIIKKIIAEKEVDGITISGGDPLEQRGELLKLLIEIHPICDDILVYTGYTLSEIKERWTKNDFNCLISNITVLIDGRYIDALNDNMSPLIGSTNQTLHFFNEGKRDKYIRYCREEGRSIQNIINGDRLISIGIHNKAATNTSN